MWASVGTRRMTSKEASLPLTCRVRPRAAIGGNGTSEQEFHTSESECVDRLSHSELRSHHILLVTWDEDPMDKGALGTPRPRDPRTPRPAGRLP